MRTFIHESRIRATPQAVYAFHDRDDIFARLIPPWQKVRVVSRQGRLEAGARVELRIYAGPFYVTWIALHTECEPDRLFVDEQERGPFQYWRHRHVFVPDSGGCLLRDEVTYSLPLRLELVVGWLLDRELRRMFNYRHEVTAREIVVA